MDRISRELRWMVDGLTQGYSHINIEGAVSADGILYTTWDHHNVRATLYALDVRTGQECWRFDADSLSAPFAANGRVFVQGRQGEDDAVFALYQSLPETAR